MRNPDPRSHPAGRMDRRNLLLGGAAALVVLPFLAACGDDDTPTSTGGSANGDDGHGAHGGLTGEGTGEMVMAAVFDANGSVVTGVEQRMPLGLIDAEGAIIAEGPEVLTVTVVDLGGNPLGEPVEVTRHDEGIFLGYYPFRYTFDTPGLYRLRAEVDGVELTQALQANERHTLNLLQPGDTLPSAATATTEDPQSVEPLCTRYPEPCGFHDVSLDEALESDRPTVLMVSTPAYCHIGICGPTLDILIELVAERDLDADVIHVEVYEDAEANGGPEGATSIPLLADLGISWEPSLWIADADGTILERIDFAFDRTEMAAALDLLA